MYHSNYILLTRRSPYCVSGYIKDREFHKNCLEKQPALVQHCQSWACSTNCAGSKLIGGHGTSVGMIGCTQLSWLPRNADTSVAQLDT